MKHLFILIFLLTICTQLLSQAPFSVNKVYSNNYALSAFMGDEVSGDYNYVVTGSCLEVVDVSNVNNPQLANITYLYEDHHFSASCLKVDDSKLYVAGEDEISSGMMVYDISSPTVPRYLGQCSLPIMPQKITANNGMVYIAGALDFVNPALCAVDCTDAENPQITNYTSQTSDQQTNITGIIYYQNTVYALDNRVGLSVYNVSNPISINRTQLFTYGSSSDEDWIEYTGLSLDSGYLYLFTLNELVRLSITNPQNVSSNRVYSIIGTEKGIVKGGYAFVGNSNGLAVKQLSATGNSYSDVAGIAEYGAILNVEYKGHTLYLSLYNGFLMYDHILDNDNTPDGIFMPPSWITDIAVHNSRVYTAAITSASVMDWQHEDLPVFSSINFSSEDRYQVDQICVDGSSVYVQYSDSERNVALCTTDNSGRLVKEYELSTGSPITDMACGDDGLYLLREDSLASYNMQDLASHQLMDVINVPDSLSHLIYRNGRLFAVSPELGMCVYSVSTIGELAVVGTYGEDGMNLAVTPDGHYACLVERSGEIKIYSINSQIVLMSGSMIPAMSDVIDITASNNYLAIMSSSCGLFLFSLEYPGDPDFIWGSNDLQIRKIVLDGSRLYTVKQGGLLDVYQVNTTMAVNQNTAAKFNLTNYPNPFNPNTTITYNLKQAGNVELKVYNVRGQAVRTLVNTNQTAGSYSIEFNGHDEQGNLLGSGVYMYRLKSGGSVSTGKMLMMK